MPSAARRALRSPRYRPSRSRFLPAKRALPPVIALAAGVSAGEGDNCAVTDDEARLRAIVSGCAWLMRVLATVRDSGLPDAWVGAGTIRDLVWGHLFGSGFSPGDVRDVDVVFFDPADLSRGRDERATGLLRDTWPEVPWQARNQ